MFQFAKLLSQIVNWRRFNTAKLTALLVWCGFVGCAFAAFITSFAPRAAMQSSAPPGASVSVRVAVPASMRSSPFNVDRNLVVPPNFSIAVYARIPNARFMAIAPNGDLLVSQPDLGKVSLVRPNPSGDPTVSNFVTGLRRPHDIVFHTINGTTYVYIAETHQINRFIYNNGDTTAHDRQLIVTGLPDNEIQGELGGPHNHALKNIAIDSQHNLYVSNASATNANPSDLAANPKRGAIYLYNAQTTQTATQGRLFAQGIRNAEGLAFLPGTDELWVVVNNRDNIAYPFRNDWDGDGTDDYGKVMPSYVDNHPPEEFTRVRDGGNYGWPFANPNPDTASGYDNMPYDLDVQTNANGQNGAANSFDRITKGIQAHSAPLGLSFLQGTNVPAAYRNGAVIGYHGSWNRTQRTGYKVAYFPWNTSTNTPGNEINLVTGWINTDQSVWGRPVDVIADPSGNLLITDDQSGTVYKLSFNAPTAPFSVTSFTLVNANTEQVISDPLVDGTVIDFNATPSISIRANTNGQVGSVRLQIGGAGSYTKIENASPYALAGDNGPGDLLPWTPPAGSGSYTLVATPYTGANGTGTAGQSLTVNFTVANAQAVTGFTLINADTDQPIAGFDAIANNALIDLSSLPTRNLTIRANTNPINVGSVRFGFLGNPNYRVENFAPYSLSADNNGDFYPLAPPLAVGTYTLTATPYSNAQAAGAAGASQTITFSVVDIAGAGLSLNSAGGATGRFIADRFFGGLESAPQGLTRSVTQSIDTSAVTNAAPPSVYQTQRYANAGNYFVYDVRALRPNTTYNLRLHFAELVSTSIGQRQFNVRVFGASGEQQLLTNFDIVAEAGAVRKAVVRDFTATSNASGRLYFRFDSGAAGGPVINGIEVLPVQ